MSPEKRSHFKRKIVWKQLPISIFSADILNFRGNKMDHLQIQMVGHSYKQNNDLKKKRPGFPNHWDHQHVFAQLATEILDTPPKTNMSPENRPSSIPTIIFQFSGAMLVSGRILQTVRSDFAASKSRNNRESMVFPVQSPLQDLVQNGSQPKPF